MSLAAAAKRHASISEVIAEEKGVGDPVYGPRFSVEVFFTTAEDATAFRAAVIDEAKAGEIQTAGESAAKAQG